MRVTIYLLEDGLKLSKDLLRRADRYRPVEVVPPDDENVQWELHVLRQETADVSWLKSLKPIVMDVDDLEITRLSSGAILFVSAHNRLFAVTFGQGFHDVHPGHVVTDFGLRVAANSVNPKKVSAGEARGLGKGARNAVSSISVPSEVFALGFSPNEEWIRRIGGQAIDSKIALSMSGADSLRLTRRDLSLQKLPKTLLDILDRYRADTYKQDFPFLDYFRRLSKDSSIVKSLDNSVTNQIKQKDESLGFAAPDEFNFWQADGYELNQRGMKPVFVRDLTPDAIYSALDTLGSWQDPLKDVSVTARGPDGEFGPVRDLRQYVVTTVRRTDGSAQGKEYALTAGVWFRIAADYAELVFDAVDRIPETPNFGLPVWNDDWLKANVQGKYAETRYNRHASEPPDRSMMDRDMYYGRAGQKIEVCDIITSDKKLICVKRLDGSDTLSHLFEQGSISTALMRDEKYREFVMSHFAACGGVGDFGENSDWTVVFAVATSRAGALKELMPFFARASLASKAETISSRGFKVVLTKIDRK